MAGLCAPLSTLRQYPHGYLRMTRGRCGSLLLHRDGLAPSTPCRSPRALRSTPVNGHSQDRRACLKGANNGLVHPKIDHLNGVLGTMRSRALLSSGAHRVQELANLQLETIAVGR